jgi:hypothetical protein
MKPPSTCITATNITVNYNNQTHIVSRSSPLAAQLLDAIKEKRYEDIPDLVSAATAITNYGKGDFRVDAGQVFVGDFAVPTFLSDKIIRFKGDGLPHEPLVNFARKLQNNPSYRSVNELSKFLEANDHPITEDGNFIAYKRVKGDFKDIHSGTFDNSVGTVVSVPRNQVDEDSNTTCSYGLHVANWDYAHTKFASSNSSTDVMLEVEVDPAHVVAVPSDYANSKMRVCEYKVLGVVDSEHSTGDRLRQRPTVAAPLDDTRDDCYGSEGRGEGCSDDCCDDNEGCGEDECCSGDCSLCEEECDDESCEEDRTERYSHIQDDKTCQCNECADCDDPPATHPQLNKDEDNVWPLSIVVYQLIQALKNVKPAKKTTGD